MVWLAWRGQRAEPGKTLIIIVLCATGSLYADPTYSGLHLSLRAAPPHSGLHLSVCEYHRLPTGLV